MTHGWSFIVQEQQVTLDPVALGDLYCTFTNPVLFIIGPPKPFSHTFRMVASSKLPAALSDVGESLIHQYANKRWYMHVRDTHVRGLNTLVSTYLALIYHFYSI